MRRLIPWIFVCFGCESATEPVPQLRPNLLVMQGPEVEDKEELAEPVSVEDHQPANTPAVDPYVDYETWCEALDKRSCKCESKDPIVCEHPTEPCPDDRTGRAQQCIRPQWARRQGSYAYACYPRWLNPREQKKQRESQRLIVEAVCEEPGWAKELAKWGKENGYGDNPNKLCWHLKSTDPALKQCKSGHFCQPKKLAKYLALIAARESTWNNETTHELNRDVEANIGAYSKAKKRGWYAGSKHFYDAYRWSQGYGWYGQNAALHTFRWDPHAPPEILCRQVESTEAYLRNVRGSFKKLWKLYGDDAKRTYKLDTGEEVQVKGVTWYDVHRAASSGKLTPQDVIPAKTGFVQRARSKHIDLDPFETVMWEMLGEEIPRDHQNEIAEEIRQHIREHFELQAAERATRTTG